MKALTLTEPWATLVCLGAKQYETRSWNTSYRGWIAIHAAKGMPKDCILLCDQQPFRAHLGEWGYLKPFKRGYIIGVTKLVATIPTEHSTPANNPIGIEFAFGDYSPGRWAWRLEGAVMLPDPIPCRGALGLWTVPEAVAGQLREA